MKAKKTMLSDDFPAKLRDLRKRRGWSQGQLAQKIGADLQRVSKYERGVIWPTMELMVAIAKAFDVTVDFLIRNDKQAAVGKIKNRELLNQLEQINDLPEEDQKRLFPFWMPLSSVANSKNWCTVNAR